MNIGSRDVVLTAATTAAMLVGITLILTAGPTLTAVGIALVVVSAIVFVVDAKDILVQSEEQEVRK